MISRRSSLATALGCALMLGATGFAGAEDKPANPSEVYGPGVQAAAVTSTPYSATRQSTATVDTLRYWNQIAIDASGLDHTPVAAGDSRKFGEQLGPGRSARAVAIVQIAVYDAANAILGGYQRYAKVTPASKPSSVDAAILAAAHDTLVAMWPSQKANFDQLYDEDLRRIVSRTQPRSRTASRSARRPPGSFSRCARATIPTSPIRRWTVNGRSAISPATGARIRSERRRSRWVRIGVK
jgi:hypothetical protein